eukprot:5950222-Karenia_brevis.AAC.1
MVDASREGEEKSKAKEAWTLEDWQADQAMRSMAKSAAATAKMARSTLQKSEDAMTRAQTAKMAKSPPGLSVISNSAAKGGVAEQQATTARLPAAATANVISCSAAISADEKEEISKELAICVKQVVACSCEAASYFLCKSQSCIRDRKVASDK